jgi:predicted MPP superfamily phosphohydrolase/energy-coupling factor transporter ATP-binding protein EcfA2
MPSRFKIIHLSDLHIKATQKNLPELGRQIARASCSVLPEEKEYLLILTGDVAYSGKEDDYRNVEGLLSELVVELKTLIHGANVHVCVVPGNHDCDLLEESKARILFRKHLAEIKDLETVDSETVTACTSVQRDYFKFHERVNGSAPVVGNDRLVHRRTFEFSGKRVSVNWINTAWMSARPEVPGSLRFPSDLLNDHADGSAFVVSAFHHPVGWLNTQGGKKFFERIEAISDLVLSGHEHSADEYLKKRSEEMAVRVVQAPALFPPPYERPHSFRLVVVDLGETRYQSQQFNFDGKIFAPRPLSDAWEALTLNRSVKREEFPLEHEFARTLTELTIDIKPAFLSAPLSLTDIYVTPPIGTASLDDQQGQANVELDEKEVERLFLNGKRLMIFGAEKSGKTSLARHVFRLLKGNGGLPVLMDGEDIVKFPATDAGFARFWKGEVQTQYTPDCFETIIQLPKSDRTAIVDNFEMSNKEPRKRAEFIQRLLTVFENVILFGSDFIRVEELVSTNQGLDETLRFDRYDLQEFGHVFRDRLIHKWLSLDPSNLTPEELVSRKGTIRNQVNVLLGNKIIPSFPFFLLILIGEAEVQTEHRLESGAFGYFYEFLITNAIRRMTLRDQGIDAIYKYLTSLARRIGDGQGEKISDDEFREFHERHCSEYKVEIEREGLCKSLCAAGILGWTNETLRFRYKYIFLYFFARGIAERLSEDSVRSQVREMCRNLQVERNAQILVFLSYLDRERFVQDEVLRYSKGLFSDLKPSDFEADVAFVDGIAKSLPPSLFEIEDGRQEANQQINLKAQDHADRQESAREAEEKAVQEANSRSLQLNQAMKTLQVLGQILRNFSGSLKGDVKEEIAEECFSLGLRSFQYFTKSIEQNMEGLIEVVQVAIKTKYPKESPQSLSEKANAFAFLVIVLIGFAYIKKVSSSVGSVKLRPTFTDLKKKSSKASIDLVDLAIRLDHYGAFPEAVIEDLGRQMKQRAF